MVDLTQPMPARDVLVNKCWRMAQEFIAANMPDNEPLTLQMQPVPVAKIPPVPIPAPVPKMPAVPKIPQIRSKAKAVRPEQGPWPFPPEPPMPTGETNEEIYIIYAIIFQERDKHGKLLRRSPCQHATPSMESVFMYIYI